MFPSTSPLSVICKAKSKKLKMKKNALDPVDMEEEKRRDPKYKTELCKSWMETNFCPYGNRCRYAHGQEELVAKVKNVNYKKKLCKSFFKNGFCPYGNRCNFMHSEKQKVQTSYYQLNLLFGNPLRLVNSSRLKVFEDITCGSTCGNSCGNSCGNNSCTAKAENNDNLSESSDDVTAFTSFNSGYSLMSSLLSSPSDKPYVCFYPKHFRQNSKASNEDDEDLKKILEF